MKSFTRLLIFLTINFAALAIGGFFTGKGVPSDWYANLNKAPWTPPGWMFGVAWSVIMICFSFYMTYASAVKKDVKTLYVLFAIQWILNIIWNPIFFYYQDVAIGLIIITALTFLVIVITLRYRSELKLRSLYLMPYIIWLLIATSLNVYILLKN